MAIDYKNKYRVICTRDYYSGDFFVDIVPAEWAIHQMIYEVRHEKNPHAYDIAGAIFLTAHPQEAQPKIEFLAKKDHMLMSDYWPYDESIFPQLEKMIQKQFAGMKEQGIITTIPLYDLDENYGMHVHDSVQEAPRSAGEERLYKARAEQHRRQRIEEDKKIRYEKDHCDPVQKMMWKQMIDCER